MNDDIVNQPNWIASNCPGYPTRPNSVEIAHIRLAISPSQQRVDCIMQVKGMGLGCEGIPSSRRSFPAECMPERAGWGYSLACCSFGLSVELPVQLTRRCVCPDTSAGHWENSTPAMVVVRSQGWTLLGHRFWHAVRRLDIVSQDTAIRW